MAKVYDSILDLVGKTPLVELKRIEEKEGLQAKLIAKVESFNPPMWTTALRKLRSPRCC